MMGASMGDDSGDKWMVWGEDDGDIDGDDGDDGNGSSPSTLHQSSSRASLIFFSIAVNNL